LPFQVFTVAYNQESSPTQSLQLHAISTHAKDPIIRAWMVSGPYIPLIHGYAFDTKGRKEKGILNVHGLLVLLLLLRYNTK
jgi:hypothetical protein